MGYHHELSWRSTIINDYQSRNNQVCSKFSHSLGASAPLLGYISRLKKIIDKMLFPVSKIALWGSIWDRLTSSLADVRKLTKVQVYNCKCKAMHQWSCLWQLVLIVSVTISENSHTFCKVHCKCPELRHKKWGWSVQNKNRPKLWHKIFLICPLYYISFHILVLNYLLTYT